jgi:heavy metal sensor kinase
MFRSLRWRLLAWHAGILVLTVAGFGTALYFQIRHARLEEIDAELQAAALKLEGVLHSVPPPSLKGKNAPGPPFGEGPPREPPFPGPDDRGRPPRPRPPPEPPERRLDRELTLPNPDPGGNPDTAPYFVVWLGDGTVLKASDRPAEVVAPDYDPGRAAAPGRPEARQRGCFREIVVGGPGGSEVLVGRSIRREESSLTWLAGQVVLTGLGVLAVGLAGGFVLSGRAVKPLAAMSSTAAGISANNLDRRIDAKGVDSELASLAAVLNDMFARLEAAFARQARFTADASHELRTPLAVIHSHAELALSRPRTAAEYQETLEACVRASRRMRSLVEGLLTLARADAGKLELRRERLDLGVLVRDAVAQLEPLAAQKGVTLSVEAPPLEYAGDATRLAQVLANLTTNAINYNRAGGRVTVTLTAEAGEAVLSVADDGCGIPPEDRAHIFERFYRVDKARSRELGGSGLGLAICKSIVEGLGGSIGFTTEVNRGTTFVVRLPSRAGTPETSGAPVGGEERERTKDAAHAEGA